MRTLAVSEWLLAPLAEAIFADTASVTSWLTFIDKESSLMYNIMRVNVEQVWFNFLTKNVSRPVYYVNRQGDEPSLAVWKL